MDIVISFDYGIFLGIIRISWNVRFCCYIFIDLLSSTRFSITILKIKQKDTLYLLLFLCILFLLIFHFLLCFFLFNLTLLRGLTELSHLLLKLSIFLFYFLLLFCITHLFLFELLFLCLELFVYLVHFLTFLEKFCRRRYGVVLVEYWDFYLFFCCHCVLWVVFWYFYFC